MERQTNSDRIERIAEAREDIARALGNLGLYDASQDEYVNPPEPEVKWAIDFDAETNFVRGRE
jgi:hypothetical protein